MKEVKNAYAIWAKSYDEDDKFNIATQSDQNLLIPILKPSKNDLILDIGCGTGRFTIPLAKKCRKVIGVDISKEMLEVAKTKSKGISNIEFLKVNGTKLPFKDQTFDKIICALVTNHIKNLRKFISEMARVLKKGGVIVYDDFCFDITKPYFNAKKNSLTKLRDKKKIEYYFHSINRNIHAIHRQNLFVDKLHFTKIDESLKHTMTPATYKRNKGHSYSIIYRLIK